MGRGDVDRYVGSQCTRALLPVEQQRRQWHEHDDPQHERSAAGYYRCIVPALNPWVYVHAGICTNGTAFAGFPDATGTCPSGTTFRLQNNLGQNAAAFAITSPLLDQALNSGLYDVMQVTWKMGYIDGGGETAWIAPLASGGIPEPGTLANLGLGLIALAFLARRRRVR